MSRPVAPLPREVRAKMHYITSKMCEAELERAGRSIEPDAQVLINELVCSYAMIAAQDLHAFCAHAGRKRIAVADVKLLARRDTALSEAVDRRVQELSTDTGAASATSAPGGTTTAGMKRGRTDATGV